MAFRERLPIHEPDFYRDGNYALFAKMGQMFICDINNISVEGLATWDLVMTSCLIFMTWRNLLNNLRVTTANSSL